MEKLNKNVEKVEIVKLNAHNNGEEMLNDLMETEDENVDAYKSFPAQKEVKVCKKNVFFKR